MPQPLSIVSPNATARLSPHALLQKPELAALVCSAIAMSSEIDHSIGLLLVRIIGADAAPTIAMYDAIQADRVKMQLLNAAAKAALTSEQHRVYDAVIKVSVAAQKERNRLAHWIWAYSPEVPDALLLANPKHLRAKDIEKLQMGTLAGILKRGWTEEDFAKLFETDRSRILCIRRTTLFGYFATSRRRNKFCTTSSTIYDLWFGTSLFRRRIA
jgi:hypothetical protein